MPFLFWHLKNTLSRPNVIRVSFWGRIVPLFLQGWKCPTFWKNVVMAPHFKHKHRRFSSENTLLEHELGVLLLNFADLVTCNDNLFIKQPTWPYLFPCAIFELYSLFCEWNGLNTDIGYAHCWFINPTILVVINHNIQTVGDFELLSP